jgi:predicted DNA binding CopG/RHH family protein
MKELKKDKVTSVRVNSELLERLKKKGVTLQNLVDDAIKQRFSIDTKIKAKSKIK